MRELILIAPTDSNRKLKNIMNTFMLIQINEYGTFKNFIEEMFQSEGHEVA